MAITQKPKLELPNPKGFKWRSAFAGLCAVAGGVLFFNIYIAYDQWANPMGSGCNVTPYVHERFKDTALCSDTLTRIRATPNLQERLGELGPISPYGFVSGKLWELGPLGQAEWDFQIQGSKNSAIVHVTATKFFRSWSISRMSVDLGSRSFIIASMQPNPSFKRTRLRRAA